MTPLRQRRIEDMRVRNHAASTQEAYLMAVAEFAKYFGKSLELSGPEEVRSDQAYFAGEKRLSWSAFNLAVCARRFLYKHTLSADRASEKIHYAKKPGKRPVILSMEEVCAFLNGRSP